jgi:hypothetical protein
VAIPPLLKNLGSFDLSGNEKDIFVKFKAFGYYSGIVSHAGLPQDTNIDNIGAQSPFFLPTIPAINFGSSLKMAERL